MPFCAASWQLITWAAGLNPLRGSQQIAAAAVTHDFRIFSVALSTAAEPLEPLHGALRARADITDAAMRPSRPCSPAAAEHVDLRPAAVSRAYGGIAREAGIAYGSAIALGHDDVAKAVAAGDFVDRTSDTLPLIFVLPRPTGSASTTSHGSCIAFSS